MKPSNVSSKILAISRAINKSLEYAATFNYNEQMTESIVNLLDLSIGLLGDEAEKIIYEREQETDIESLRFTAI